MIGYTLEQLMEIAGLAVAQSIEKEFPPSSHRRVLVVCGPGNNGGDGLVAARHLALFGYCPAVVLPKAGRNPHYTALQVQLSNFGVHVKESITGDGAEYVLSEAYDLAVDAVFGFSFRPTAGAACAAESHTSESFATTKLAAKAAGVRPPFCDVLARLRHADVPVVSVDVPSGWDVEEGDVYGCGVLPSMLVSLTVPKQSARKFDGIHYIGGRFLPPCLAQKYGIALPEFEGHANVVRVQ
jgi:NAD(P)H-hydrate epimerase